MIEGQEKVSHIFYKHSNDLLSMNLMQSKKILICAIFMIGMFFIPTPGLGQENNNDYQFQNDKFAIKITSNENVPQFSFWEPGNNKSTKYQIKFLKLFESVDENGDGQYNKKNESIIQAASYSLSSLDWEFSDLSTEGNITHFNITSTGESFILQLRNHFDAGDTSLKFDIIIEDYTFESDDEDVMLVLGFHLLGNRNRDQVQQEQRNRVEFGDTGYIESEPEASGGNETISVKMSNGEENNNKMAYISFPRFEGDLYHDPTIGFNGSINIPGYSSLWISFFPIIGILYLVMKNRVRKY